MTQNLLAPGWYDDPSGLPTQRWWDGDAWTDQLAPKPVTLGEPNRAFLVTEHLARKPQKNRVWLWVGLGVAGLAVIAAVVAILVVRHHDSSPTAGDASAQSDLRNAIAVLETCNSDSGTYPEAPAPGEKLTGAVDLDCGGSPENITFSGGNAGRYQSDGSRYTLTVSAPDGNFTYSYDSSTGGTTHASRR